MKDEGNETVTNCHALKFRAPDGKMPGTVENLADATEGENFEWADMYARMAAEARAEGFDEIAEYASPRDRFEVTYWIRID